MLFLKRVSEELAEDYKCYVPHESFIELVQDRLRGNYYRSK